MSMLIKDLPQEDIDFFDSILKSAHDFESVFLNIISDANYHYRMKTAIHNNPELSILKSAMKYLDDIEQPLTVERLYEGFKDAGNYGGYKYIEDNIGYSTKY
jgi:hypothetical protein